MTGDLVERLRSALAERERGIDRRERDAELRAEPRERWEQHHYAAAERLERLRTIQAHRKILDEFDRVRGASNEALDRGQNDLVIALRAKEVALEVAVGALASIYFPEETES